MVSVRSGTMVSSAKLWRPSVRRAAEGTISRVDGRGKHSARSLAVESHHGIRDAASTDKVNIEAIAAKVKQEFAAKDRKKTALSAAKTSKKEA
jgi:ParB family chromosome partitioning protein